MFRVFLFLLSPLCSPLSGLATAASIGSIHQDIIESAATVALSDLHLQLFAYHPLLVLFLIFSFHFLSHSQYLSLALTISSRFGLFSIEYQPMRTDQ